MLSVYFRVFIKLLFFIGINFVVIFFIVYGYRYESEIGFVQKNVYFHLDFWSDLAYVNMDSNYYYTDVGHLDLYNFEEGCYDIEYYGQSYKVCLENDESFNDVFVQSTKKEYLGLTMKNQKCNNVHYLTHGPFSVKNRKFSNKITNVFEYKNIKFVKVQENLFICNNDFSRCKKIAEVEGDVVCGNENGLIFHNNFYTLLKIY